jgi:ring-1,2-phenylacetyl-CoA epoxidase subunit PaaB
VSDFSAEGGHGAVPISAVPISGVPISGVPVQPEPGPVRSEWPLYEVFLRGKRGLNHVHVGSLHAADPQMALRHARDLYTRRNEGVSIWVVAASDITASSPDEKDPFFAPSGDKVYRHPTFYQIPDDVPHM